MHIGFQWESQKKEETTRERDLDVRWRIILKWILEG
jgi:hypothetical protein